MRVVQTLSLEHDMAQKLRDCAKRRNLTVSALAQQAFVAYLGSDIRDA